MHDKLPVAVGDTVTVNLPYSEVCMHLRVAGQRHQVRLETVNSAQILTLDGGRVSFPVTPAEAGLYRDADGFYVTAAVPAEASPAPA